MLTLKGPCGWSSVKNNPLTKCWKIFVRNTKLTNCVSVTSLSSDESTSKSRRFNAIKSVKNTRAVAMHICKEKLKLLRVAACSRCTRLKTVRRINRWAISLSIRLVISIWLRCTCKGISLSSVSRIKMILGLKAKLKGIRQFWLLRPASWVSRSNLLMIQLVATTRYLWWQKRRHF